MRGEVKGHGLTSIDDVKTKQERIENIKKTASHILPHPDGCFRYFAEH